MDPNKSGSEAVVPEQEAYDGMPSKAAQEQFQREAEERTPEDDEAVNAAREAAGFKQPSGKSAGVTDDDATPENSGKPSQAAFEEHERAQQAANAGKKRGPSFEPEEGDESPKAKLYRATIPKNGGPGLLTQEDEDNQLRSVDSIGPAGNRCVSAQFSNGMTVNFSPRIKEASGLQTDADRRRAASMIIAQCQIEGKTKVKIHGDDPLLVKELYKHARDAKLDVSRRSILKMRAKDLVSAEWGLLKEKGDRVRKGAAFGTGDPNSDAGNPAAASADNDNDWIKVRKDDPRLAGLAGDMARSPTPDMAAAAMFAASMEKLMERAGRSVSGQGNVAATGDHANAVNGNGNAVGTGNVVINGPVTVNVDGRSINGASDLRGMMDQFGGRGGNGGGGGGGRGRGPDAPIDIGPQGGGAAALPSDPAALLIGSAKGRLHEARTIKAINAPDIAGYLEGPSGPPQLGGAEKRKLLTGPVADAPLALPGTVQQKALPAPEDMTGGVKRLAAPQRPLALPPPRKTGM